MARRESTSGPDSPSQPDGGREIFAESTPAEAPNTTRPSSAQWLIGMVVLAAIVAASLGFMRRENDASVVAPVVDTTLAPVATPATSSPSLPAATAEPEQNPPAAQPTEQASNAPSTSTSAAETAANVSPGDIDIVPCTGEHVVLVFAITNSERTDEFVREQLDRFPAARALQADESCSSLLGDIDGKPIVAIYQGPYANPLEACVVRNGIGGDAYVKHLTPDPATVPTPCTSVRGFETHIGDFFQVEVPAGTVLRKRDTDEGYGFRTEYDSDAVGLIIDITPGFSGPNADMEFEASKIAQGVAGASEVYYADISGIDAWYFWWLSDDGRYKLDAFFELGGDGYAVIAADEKSPEMAFGIAAHSISTLQPER